MARRKAVVEGFFEPRFEEVARVLERQGRRLAVGFVNNRAGGTPLGDVRILQIGAAAVRSADRAPETRRAAG